MFNITPVDVGSGVVAGQELTGVGQVSHGVAEAVLAAVSLPGLSPTSVKLVADVVAQLGHVVARGLESSVNTVAADDTTVKVLQGFVSQDVVNSLEF